MNFLTNLKANINESFNVSITENGALGYKTTGNSLLDLNFSVASLRKASENEIVKKFIKAYHQEPKTAIVWLFYARDIRGGLGERRLFRIILKYLAGNNHEIPFEKLIKYIPEYGRYDDLHILLYTRYMKNVITHIKLQLEKDMEDFNSGNNISLLAKWLPSVNASNIQTKETARLIASELKMTERDYRKMLSALRKHIDVVECKMSAGRFHDICYEAVPSRANIIYKNAFLLHDNERRNNYLQSLAKGETKINAGVLYPHEIVHAYVKSNYINMFNMSQNMPQVNDYDETLEQLWKSLPDTLSEDYNTIVVADGSGSMMTPVGDGRCSALSVANALAIYFAERSKGAYKNHYITFSTSPQLVDLSGCKTLKMKLQTASKYDEVSNTDIYKVFKLILDTAVGSRAEQKDLPKNILIISDMEFDSCANNANGVLFLEIQKEYNRYGYSLPRLVFWNVNSRTGTIPINQNKLGVALVSGFSVNIAKMVMSNELDPYKCLLNVLYSERYIDIKNIVECL